ncbi:MAG: hypothetical protein ABIJ08_06515 [Nanoarchaeota archaeon]
MKIAVCGSGNGNDSFILEKVKQIGMEIAKSGCILLVGGCRGYPYAALRGAFLANGKVIVYSPGKDQDDHEAKYGFPIDSGVDYVYTGLGIPERNTPLVKNADAVIIVDGSIGTLNEFTIAFHEKKKIGVLKSGGITSLIPRIAEICDKNGEKDNIVYGEDARKLVKQII